MKVQYTENGDVAFYNGYKFRRDKKTGYYLSRRLIGDRRKRLHVYIWENEVGPIASGHSVHHIDENKAHNDIENFRLMETGQHSRLHLQEYISNNPEKVVENLHEKAMPKAKEWHASEKGRQWHKEHYENMKERLYVKHDFRCLVCGKEFSSTQTESKFCSNNCKSAYRRRLGLDNITAKCAVCGKEFVKNKYARTKTCSRRCATALLICSRNNICWQSGCV